MRNAESKSISREELYELIWSKPASSLAKEFCISDVGLGKICKRMEIPKPSLGYWRKVEVGGHLPRKPKLKKLSPKGQQKVAIHKNQFSQGHWLFVTDERTVKNLENINCYVIDTAYGITILEGGSSNMHEQHLSGSALATESFKGLTTVYESFPIKLIYCGIIDER